MNRKPVLYNWIIRCLISYLAGSEVTMGSAVERTDEHVREYLIYRGFTSTLKHLDGEIKADKEKGFRVRLILFKQDDFSVHL